MQPVAADKGKEGREKRAALRVAPMAIMLDEFAHLES